MDLNSIIDLAHTGAIGIIIILVGMIKIPKAELNLWKLLARTFGRAINGEIMTKVDKLTKELEKHIQDEEEDKAKRARQRFLQFSDELIEGRRHSREHFDEILEEIDTYIDYCIEHPKYENSKAELAIANIKKTYQDRLDDHKF